MIHVDVFVPLADERLEFRCSGEVPVSDVCRDIYEILSVKYGGKAEEDKGSYVSFWLCDKENGHILSKNRSLLEEGVHNGSQLIFL